MTKNKIKINNTKAPSSYSTKIPPISSLLYTFVAMVRTKE
jgi:hypothetical protein